MSIIGQWGFEAQDLVRDKVVKTNGSLFYETSVLPPLGASQAALEFNSDFPQAELTLQNSPSGNDFWIHAQWYWTINNNNNDAMRLGWQSGSTLAGYITRENNTSRLQIVVDGSVVATSVDAMPLSAWKRLHIHVDYQNSVTGFVRVYQDGNVTGTPVVEFTGDTNPSAYGAIDRLLIGDDQGSHRVDDLVVMDPNDATGITDVNDIAFATIGPRVPTANGADAAWANSGGGTAWEDIDEIPVSDADYISVGSTGQASTFDFENSVFGRVVAVKVMARTIRSGTNAGASIAIRQRLGATVTDSADIAMPGDGDVHLILNTDADGNSWTGANFDNTEFGVVSKT